MNISTDSVTLRPEPPVARGPRTLLTPLSDPGHFLLVLDNSAMEKFVTCPRSAEYYLVRRREAHARNAALTFGGAVHIGLECIERGEDEVPTAQKVLKFFTENPTPPDEYRTPTTALEVLAHYRVRRTFPDFEWQVLSDDNGLLLERAFELPLGVIEVNDYIKMPWLNSGDNNGKGIFCDAIHVAWSGRIDAIAHVNGMARVVDHKTTSIAGDQFIQDFQLSNQTVGYLWAARQLWPDLSINGFCLNAIHLKKPSKGQGLMDRGARGGDPPLNFFRAFFEYSDARVAEWEHNALTLSEDFVHCLVRGYHPMATKWCFGKYGKCQYHDVCVMEPNVRESILMSDMYKQVTWNPTDDR